MTQALATRTCAYAPCSKEFEPEHWRQKFCKPTCRANQHYVDNPEKGRRVVNGALRCVAGDALDLVRGDAEESPEKARWTLIVREQIAHTLMEKGWFSVRDLDDLDIPAEHINVCTSQIGSFASGKHMVKRTWHRSEKVSRKGGPYWTFQITASGRNKLPTLLQDTRSKLADLIAGPGSDETPEGAAGLASAESPVSPAPITSRPGEGQGVGNPAPKSDRCLPPVVAADASSPDPLPGLSPVSAYSGENPYA